ncbi:MAG: hypothetical protein M3N31_09525 [Actinomycetota bacterium]|nr:hypothetical protein [Actinomycetota bacterium]
MEDTIHTASVLVDPDELKAAETDMYIKAGLAKVNRAEETVPDTDAMKERAYKTVTSRVANDRSEMAAKGLTQGELYAAVFPGAPGTDPRQVIAELTPLEQALRSRLHRAVWNLTNPGRKGNIQNRLGKEGRTEVLIRAKIQRGVDEIVGVFVTDNPELIMQESVHPVVEKLLSAAREVRLHNELVIEERHPELAPQVAKALNLARKRVVAELARPPMNGDTAALPAGHVTNEAIPAE